MIVELEALVLKMDSTRNFMENKTDCSFLPCSTERLVTIIEQVVVAALKKGYTKRDIQVLAPDV